jgi:hypothetical protein
VSCLPFSSLNDTINNTTINTTHSSKMYIPNVHSILAAGLALTGMPELMKKREYWSGSGHWSGCFLLFLLVSSVSPYGLLGVGEIISIQVTRLAGWSRSCRSLAPGITAMDFLRAG